MEGAFVASLGNQDNTQFSIAFVLKISIMLSSIDRTISLFPIKLKYLKSNEENVKIAFNFLLDFNAKIFSNIHILLCK